MSEFITRVELHQGAAQNYDVLHAAMVRAGFSRTIRGSNGATYHLPWAEYYVNTPATIEQVRSLAVTAANTTGRSSAVLVSETSRIAWQGLNQA